MANRTPLVLGSDGLPQQGQAADTLTVPGPIAVNGGTVLISGQSGTNRSFVLQTSGSYRWQFYADNTSESGSNSGSNFAIAAYNDSGSYIDTPISMGRASGSALTIARPLYASKGIVVANVKVFAATPTPIGVTSYAGDADYALTLGTTKSVVRLTGTITANRTLTLSGGDEGNKYRVVRTGGGTSYSWSIGGLKSLAQNTWCDVEWDVTTAAWILTAYGSL